VRHFSGISTGGDLTRRLPSGSGTKSRFELCSDSVFLVAFDAQPDLVCQVGRLFGAVSLSIRCHQQAPGDYFVVIEEAYLIASVENGSLYDRVNRTISGIARVESDGRGENGYFRYRQTTGIRGRLSLPATAQHLEQEEC